MGPSEPEGARLSAAVVVVVIVVAVILVDDNNDDDYELVVYIDAMYCGNSAMINMDVDADQNYE